MYVFFPLQIIIMEDDNCIVAGIRAVLDLKGVTLGHFMQMTPIQMRKLVVSLQVIQNFKLFILPLFLTLH